MEVEPCLPRRAGFSAQVEASAGKPVPSSSAAPAAPDLLGDLLDLGPTESTAGAPSAASAPDFLGWI